MEECGIRLGCFDLLLLKCTFVHFVEIEYERYCPWEKGTAQYELQ